MKVLTFIQLAIHLQLVNLPSFAGLVNLKSLSLIALYNVQAIPFFESTGWLERLVILSLASVTILPDFAPLKRLIFLVFFGRGMVCCNGFLGTACDLSHSFCQANTLNNLPTATCLQASDIHASSATQSVFQRFQGNVCDKFELRSLPENGESNICENVANRMCPANAHEDVGICVGTRMMVIECEYEEYFVTARREQIKRRIGVACDPDEESWLGCSRSF